MAPALDRPMTRSAAILVTAVLCFGNVLATPSTAAAVPVTTPCATGTPLHSDFDGDGAADLVVAYRHSGQSEEWVQPSDGGSGLRVQDSASLVSADLNGDVCADAILVPGQDTDSRYGKWLEMVPGTPDGLDRSASTRVQIPLASDSKWFSSEGEYSLRVATAGLRHDGISQVAALVTMEHEDVDAGAVVYVFTLDAGMNLAATQTLASLEGESGFSLAADGRTIAIGDPNWTLNRRMGVGAVLLYTPKASDSSHFVKRVTLTQNSRGIPGVAEADDDFGDSIALRNGRLAIGVPGEDVGKTKDSGVVQLLRWNETKRTYSYVRQIDQNTRGIPGTNESGDRFGATVKIARNLTAAGSYDVVIGAPSEDVGDIADAGSITVANYSKSLYDTYTGDSAGMPGAPTAYQHFGNNLGVLRASSGPETVLIGTSDDGTGLVLRSDGHRFSATTTWTEIPVPADAPDPAYWGWQVGADG